MSREERLMQFIHTLGKRGEEQVREVWITTPSGQIRYRASPTERITPTTFSQGRRLLIMIESPAYHPDYLVIDLLAEYIVYLEFVTDAGSYWYTNAVSGAPA